MPEQKWETIIKPYRKEHDIRAMVLRRIWVGDRSDVVMIKRDETTVGEPHGHLTGLADVVVVAELQSW